MKRELFTDDELDMVTDGSFTQKLKEIFQRMQLDQSGLRDAGGRGVITGLTNISRIVATKFVDGKKKPCDGELWYRGHEIMKSMMRSILAYSYYDTNALYTSVGNVLRQRLHQVARSRLTCTSRKPTYLRRKRQLNCKQKFPVNRARNFFVCVNVKLHDKSCLGNVTLHPICLTSRHSSFTVVRKNFRCKSCLVLSAGNPSPK